MVSRGFGNVPHWTELPDDCSLTYPIWGGEDFVLAPGCDRIFRALAADLEGYREAGQELLDGPFAEARMIEAIDEYAALIRDAAQADPRGPGAGVWEGAVEALRREMWLLRGRLERLLSGEPWVPMEIDVEAVMGFEAQDDFGLWVGPYLGCNFHSTVSVEVNTSDPMVGDQHVLMSFEYANEEAAWEQWTTYRIPLTLAPYDLTSYAGIRMRVRADQERILRFDLYGPESSARDQGITYGWEIPVSTEPTEVELLFEDAALPAWAIAQGRDPGDDFADVLATVASIAFHPMCVGRASDGFLPEGTTDLGFLAVDEIEFF
jgi:hypothetical protein